MKCGRCGYEEEVVPQKDLDLLRSADKNVSIVKNIFYVRSALVTCTAKTDIASKITITADKDRSILKMFLSYHLF